MPPPPTIGLPELMIPPEPLERMHSRPSVRYSSSNSGQSGSGMFSTIWRRVRSVGSNGLSGGSVVTDDRC